jgi:hypothetical protein
MGLFNPAGGLSYHLKALRYYRNWTNFRSDLQRWLEGWGISKEEIFLIGPSAGYTLPPPWLNTFKSRTAIEPDPIARLAFSQRFGKTNWLTTKWFKVDYASLSGFFSLKEFEKLCHEHPKAPFLFCNILGQLPVLYRNEVRNNPTAFESWKRDFAELLRERTFASYHDIFSSDRDFVLLGSDREWAGGSNIVDHQTSDLFSSFSDRCYFKWPLTPQKYHLIEGVRHLAPS